MHAVEARQLLQEAHRRFAPRPPAHLGNGVVGDVRRKLRGRLFDKQLAFLDDTSKKKAARCSRRAGKTTETAVDEVDGNLEAAAAGIGGTKTLYATLTRERAKELLWPELRRLDQDLQLGMRFNEVELTATLPEQLGSGIVKLVGADKAKEIEKRRGDKLKRVRIDEAQAFGEYLRPFVTDVLEPALMDLEGDLGLLGTPGPVCAGLFYEATTGRAPGWATHHWTVLDNPHIPHARKWLEAKRREMGWTDESPTYRREWLGEWVNDTGALFYRFDAARHLYTGPLPAGHDWMYVLGWDLGFHDDNAFVAWAFARTLPDIYEAYSWKASGITPSAAAEKAQAILEDFPAMALVADTGGLGKAIVEDVRERYALDFEAAEKRDKLAGVQLMNDDFDRGLIHLREGSPLAQELAILPKDPDDPTREDSRFANHCADAGLYAFRKALHFLGHRVTPGPVPGSAEAAVARMQAHEDALEEALLEQQREEAAAWEDMDI